MVQGAKIPLEDCESILNAPEQNSKEHRVFETDAEVAKLINLGVIEECSHSRGEIISSIFLVPKPDGSFRLILNLKDFNKSVTYEHFKMENLWSATNMITKGCYMASVDLRHAYYSVPIRWEDRKYLRFEWSNRLYQFTCFPNGLSNCPRFFTKLLKPVYSHLRSQGHLSAAFIDDSYLQGKTFEECSMNIKATVELFEALGFVIHEKKSVLTPCKRVKYLGFWLDSENMTITLPEEKAQKVKDACTFIMSKEKLRIRDLAKVIGLLVASFPAVTWGPLFYRELERSKISALKENRGNFDAIMQVTPEGRAELTWWIENIQDSCVSLESKYPSLELRTDASKLGWGAVSEGIETGGRWSCEEQELHINALELLAIEYALKAFLSNIKGKHIKVLTDNTCAVSYLRNMGGIRSLLCNKIAQRIWIWCKERGIWLSVSHIPGKENEEADSKSRLFNDRTEWQLNPRVFAKVTNKFLLPEIDLFASRLNCQVKRFVSWGPDPDAWAVDAFSITWENSKVYAFPPFSLMHKVLNKWQTDKATGIIIAPFWTTATWFPVLMRLLTDFPVFLPRGPDTLRLPHNLQLKHPLHKKLQLMACCCSGKPSAQKDFTERLLTLSWHPGEHQRKNNTVLTSPDGVCSVLNGVLIPFVYL